MAYFVRRARNVARLCEAPPCAKNRPQAQPSRKITARRPGRQVRPADKGHKNGWDIALGLGLANFVRRTRNGARLCEAPPCAKNRPRTQPRPKITARRPGCQVRPAEKGHKNGLAIALGDGAGPLRPPDSECRKNNRLKAGAPSSSSGKRPQKRVGYSLGGWGWPTSSAGLGMPRDFTRGLRVPNIGRG